MIDHVSLRVTDSRKSRRFYDEALVPLGYKMLFEVEEHAGEKAAFGYGVPPRADFWIGEGTPNSCRVHIAFPAETRAQVDEFYKAALAAGGKDNGAPGLRPHYHKDYYGAFVLDPDGHNIEAVCRGEKGA